MKISRVALAILFAYGIGLATESSAWAQKGRGRGGGGKPFRGGAFGGNGFQKAGGNGRAFTNELQRNPIDSGFKVKTKRPNHSPRKSVLLDGSTDHRRILVEQRKLEHRQQVAEHLRRVGEKNGNPQLGEVADRLDLKAKEHYQRQLNKIDSQQLKKLDHVARKPAVHSDRTGTLEPNADSVLEQNTIEGSRENAQHQRLLVEERKLNQRMSMAEKLRTMAEQQRNPQLDEASRHLEEMALEHYTDQLSKLTDFQGVDRGQ